VAYLWIAFMLFELAFCQPSNPSRQWFVELRKNAIYAYAGLDAYSPKRRSLGDFLFFVFVSCEVLGKSCTDCIARAFPNLRMKSNEL